MMQSTDGVFVLAILELKQLLLLLLLEILW